MTGPLFKWFGSKWLSAKTLPPPIHDSIIEPFAGSAGYALRHARHQVLVCETDPHVHALWTWIVREATEDAIRAIPVSVPEGTDIRTLGLSAGQALLLKTWQRTNNVGDCWTVSPWGNKPGQWTANTRARVAAEHHEVKHWRVGELDGIGTLAQPATAETTWFVDPPYQYNYSYRQAHPDYERLARLILAQPGQRIVCEALCAKTDARPDWLPFVDFGNRITSRRKAENHHHSRELIWASN